MAGDGAIPESPKSKSFADRPVRSLRSGQRATASAAAMLQTGTSPEACADKAATPSLDHLTTMIRAHAAESERALQKAASATSRIDAILANIADTKDSRRRQAKAAPPAADHKRRARQLNVCVVGLVVAVGGSAFYVSEAGKEQPPAIAAAEALEARSVVIGNANANDKPMEEPAQTADPGDSQTTAVEEARIDEGGIGSKGGSGEHSNDQAVVTPVVGQPVGKLGSDAENRADGAAGEGMPTEAAPAEAAPPATTASAEELPQDAASPPPAIPEKRPAIDRANDAVALQVGRVTSGVNMRAGPGNGQAVVATIPAGSPIQVVKCAHWCEVIFAGQRGWVYKTFIRAPLADGAMPPERARPRPRKVGSNAAVLGGTQAWAWDPRRPKPAAVRLATDQSTRDARSRSQSSSGPILWDTIVYLWKQIRPAGFGPSSE